MADQCSAGIYSSDVEAAWRPVGALRADVHHKRQAITVDLGPRKFFTPERPGGDTAQQRTRSHSQADATAITAADGSLN